MLYTNAFSHNILRQNNIQGMRNHITQKILRQTRNIASKDDSMKNDGMNNQLQVKQKKMLLPSCLPTPPPHALFMS